MSEWWTYRPADFLLFSPRVYWRMFELHNEAIWPLHAAMLAAGLAIVLFALRRPQGHGLRIALMLAGLWAFAGWSFLWNRYAEINWAAVYIAPVFWLQALLLAAAGTIGGLTFDRQDMTARFGYVLAAAGLLAYPLLPPLFGRPWTSAEVFGIAPDPTATVTLGILLLAGGRMPLLLLIPVLWLLLSGLTLHTLGDAQAWVPLSAAGAAVLASILRGLAR